MTIWDKCDVEREEVKLFDIMKEEIGFEGDTIIDCWGQRAFRIKAPGGAVRVQGIKPDLFKTYMDGKPKKNGLWEMEKKLCILLMHGEEDSTDFLKMSDEDYKWFDDLDMKLLEFKHYPMPVF